MGDSLSYLDNLLAQVTYLYHSLVDQFSRCALFTNANICQSKDMQLHLIKNKSNT